VIEAPVEDLLFSGADFWQCGHQGVPVGIPGPHNGQPDGSRASRVSETEMRTPGMAGAKTDELAQSGPSSVSRRSDGVRRQLRSRSVTTGNILFDISGRY